MMPSYAGGMNWGGLAFDPHQQIVVVNTMEIPSVVQLIKREQFEFMKRSEKYPESQFTAQTGTPYGMRRQMLISSLGAPCSAPPWGRLAAVDMTKGEIIWQVPFGTIEDLVPDFFPNLELGVPGMGGPIITAGGIAFIGASMDDYIRAFNLATGEEVWKHRLPAGGQATPMTYVIDDKQYVVIAAGGHKAMGTRRGDYVVAFSL